MKKIRLFLARHGNTFNAEDTCVMVGSKTDLPLTDFGYCQARKLADFFKSQQIVFDKIYSGNLARQIQTAAAIADEAITHVKALDEIDYGLWEGLTNDEIHEKWPKEFEAWSEKGKWATNIFGEDFERKKALLRTWIESLDPNDQTILAVSSGGTIRLLLYLMPKLGDFDFKAYKMNTGYFCELLVEDDALEIKQWNEAP